ncbi:uncharacterized protein [Euwallacea fornicatus]|uniref:uncharacterized protein n=1 Tax=Euwallacea fornicatus TaxID=995702 RepID=UPI00338EE850
MHEYILNNSPANALRLSGFQTTSSANANQQKSMLTNISSNVYYGYQPLRPPVDVEPMQTETCQKISKDEDSRQEDLEFLSCKRRRELENDSPESWKRRRLCDVTKLMQHSQKVSPSKMNLEEDLLRETHGCSYYHWIATNTKVSSL